MIFNDEQLLRYNRHILLENVDIEGQTALANSTVVIVGLGGLGCPAAQYLCAAGIGHLVLCDGDTVDASNLQRQVLYTESQIGSLKTTAAAKTLSALNSHVKITEVPEFVDAKVLSQWVATASVVLDCSDNIATRYAVNTVCKAAVVPLISASAIGWSGQQISFDFRQPDSPCYRCVFPGLNEQDLSCNDSGVMGPVVGLMGVHQALASVKVLLGLARETSVLQCFDGLSGQWQSFAVTKQEGCAECGCAG